MVCTPLLTWQPMNTLFKMCFTKYGLILTSSYLFPRRRRGKFWPKNRILSVKMINFGVGYPPMIFEKWLLLGWGGVPTHDFRKMITFDHFLGGVPPEIPFHDYVIFLQSLKSGVKLKFSFFCKNTLSTEFSKLICLCKRYKKNRGRTLKTISGATQFQCVVAYTATLSQENSCWIKISDRQSSLQFGQPY